MGMFGNGITNLTSKQKNANKFCIPLNFHYLCTLYNYYSNERQRL